MNTQPIRIKRALISVSDKTNLIPFAQTLVALGVEILSTGGNALMLTEAGIQVTPVENITGFPEIMDGRVKTLHPKIHGGILGLRDRHAPEAQAHQIDWIDLVVCNLYPFAQTIARGAAFDEAVEQIDIGGPTMLRAAAKNLGWVCVVTDRADYDDFLAELSKEQSISFSTRQYLSAKAFQHTAHYDAMIQSYLTSQAEPKSSQESPRKQAQWHQLRFPNELTYGFTLHRKNMGAEPEDADDRLLRYGENPHQRAAVYRSSMSGAQKDSMTLLDATVLQGKRLSYNNFNDTQGALDTLREFAEFPACVIVKHANPCGVAVGSPSDPIAEIVERAFKADEVSAFGGIVAMNRDCDEATAKFFSNIFFEVLLAPSFSQEALSVFKKKRNLRLLATGAIMAPTPVFTPKFFSTDLLLQDKDVMNISPNSLVTVTERTPSEDELKDLIFAWNVVKHVKSNAILTACQSTTVGIGPGQVSRVDAVRIAMAKGLEQEERTGKEHPYLVLASDAFFPFRDNIDALAGSKVTAIIQPGGSIRDDEVIAACNELGIAMVFTGVRSFNHG